MIGAVGVDGRVVAYERRGSGAPVVLVHGYVGDGPATWRPQLDGLADDFDLVAWDLPGAGHLCNTDAIEPFDTALRQFLGEHPPR